MYVYTYFLDKCIGAYYTFGDTTFLWNCVTEDGLMTLNLLLHCILFFFCHKVKQNLWAEKMQPFKVSDASIAPCIKTYLGSKPNNMSTAHSASRIIRINTKYNLPTTTK